MKKLLSIGKILSKIEQKRILGGDYGYGGSLCKPSFSCQLYVRELNATYTGECHYQIAGDCWCQVEQGGHIYRTEPGVWSQSCSIL